jgi:hypothetical protein
VSPCALNGPKYPPHFAKSGEGRPQTKFNAKYYCVIYPIEVT